MPTTPPPPIPEVEAPPRPDGGRATSLASSVSSEGFGVDAERPGVPHAGLRLAALVAVLVWLGISNPWVLVVILALVVMITLHEFGHYYMAKRAGMKVTEFFLGFGPKIWSIRRGETEYGIKVIPAGAYVKIPGMVNIDEVPAEDEGRTYRQKSFWQRVGVAVAGSTMHFLLALVLIYVSIVVIGQPGGALTTNAATRPPVIETVVDGSGADDAGLQPGDQITEIDGTEVATAQELQETIAPLKGSTVSMTWLRDGASRTGDVDLRAYTFEADDGTTERSCGMGIIMARADDERVSPVTGLVETPKQFAEIVGISATGLGRFFSPSGIKDFASQVGNAQDDREAQTQEAEQEQATTGDPCAAGASSGSSTSGGASENRILSIYGLVRIGSDVGGVDPGALIGLFALINIFIGMFNLVPLLPFDGGHVAIAVYEKVQERRLHRRRYFADVSRLLPLTYAVVIALGMLFVSSLYLDIINPIGG